MNHTGRQTSAISLDDAKLQLADDGFGDFEAFDEDVAPDEAFEAADVTVAAATWEGGEALSYLN